LTNKVGIVLVNLLNDKLRVLSDVIEPNREGMEPINEFSCSCKDVNKDNVLNVAGNVPVKLFESRFNVTRDGIDDRVVGIFPFNEFPRNDKIFRVVTAPMVVGIDPAVCIIRIKRIEK